VIKREPYGITWIEWAIIAVIVVIIAGMIGGAVGRSRECKALLRDARTHQDSLSIRLACNVRESVLRR
jgi:hypothetical protein